MILSSSLLVFVNTFLTELLNDASNFSSLPTNGKDTANPEKETEEEANEGEEDEEEPGVPGNEDGTTFEQQEFVRSKPVGISFGLHEPTKVKPQPKELSAPAQAPLP